MTGMSDPHFWLLWGVGFLGVALWCLKTWADPKDDRLSGTLRSALFDHSRSTAVAILAHLFGCILLREGGPLIGLVFGFDVPPAGGYLNFVTAIMSGYGSQSLVFAILGSKLGGKDQP